MLYYTPNESLAAMMLAAVGSSADQSKRIVKSLCRTLSESWSSKVDSMKNKALLASASKTALSPTNPSAAAGDVTRLDEGRFYFHDQKKFSNTRKVEEAAFSGILKCELFLDNERAMTVIDLLLLAILLFFFLAFDVTLIAHIFMYVGFHTTRPSSTISWCSTK